MFAYCLNDPVSRADAQGYISYTEIEDQNNDNNVLNDVAKMGDGSLGQRALSRAYTFVSESKLMKHFTDHNKSFGNIFQTPTEYLATANYVIQNGQYISDMNAYVKFYGLNGHGNYAFVGMTRDQEYITTFHVKPAYQIFK